MPDNKATRSKSILGRLQRNLSRHRDRTSSTASSRSTAQPTVDILDTVFSEVDRAECRRTSTEECTQRQHDEEQFESDLLLRRPRRALGRSQSEGRKQRQLGVVSSRDLVLGHKVDWTREGKMGGPDRTIDLVGLCWDGREQGMADISALAPLAPLVSDILQMTDQRFIICSLSRDIINGHTFQLRSTFANASRLRFHAVDLFTAATFAYCNFNAALPVQYSGSSNCSRLLCAKSSSCS